MAALLVAVPWAVACAADAGDGPKGDSGSGDDMVNPVDAAEGAAQDHVNPMFDGRGPDGNEASAMDQSAEDADGGGGDTGGDVIADVPDDVPTCNNCPLVVEYLTTTTTATTQDIRPHLQIINNGNSAQDMTQLTVRYWFTADGSTSQAFACDYAMMGCGIVSANFVTMAMAKNEADHYLELSFTGGSINPGGGSSGEIQARFHDTNYQVTFTQTNDYSFDATKTQYAQWANVTLYRNGTLVWGTEPQ